MPKLPVLEPLWIAPLLPKEGARGRKTVVDVVVVLNREPHLLQIVRAFHASSRLTSRLNGREKKADQDADDRDNDQQLDKGEALAIFTSSNHVLILRC